MDLMYGFHPIYRRFIIISMIALVFINISLICQEINTQIEDKFNILAKMRKVMEGGILGFGWFTLSDLVIFLIVKRFMMKVNFSTLMVINCLIGLTTSWAYIFLMGYLFLDLIQIYGFQIHCTELIVFQFIVILHTYMVNWKPQFLVV